MLDISCGPGGLHRGQLALSHPERPSLPLKAACQVWAPRREGLRVGEPEGQELRGAIGNLLPASGSMEVPAKGSH